MAEFVNPTYEQIWNKEGFIVIENIFTDTEIEQLRDEILTYSENKDNIIFNYGGYSIVDFIQYHPSLTLCKQILAQITANKNITDQLLILGPIPASMERRAGKYRFQLLLQSQQRSLISKTLQRAMANIDQLPESRKVRWSIDVDPIDFT